MSAYLGDRGTVELRRTGEPVLFDLGIDDVNVTASRMSVESGGMSPFVTGDRVEVTRIDGTADLELLAGKTGRNFTRYIHVDGAGGIRFYDDYADALDGAFSTANALALPTTAQNISIDIVNADYNCIAQMRQWELTTTRETVDVTLLGEEFRSSFDQGLISGQGQIGAIWEYQQEQCDPMTDSDDSEVAHYFSQLVIRFKEGAKFKGRFFLLVGQTVAVWYEADCIVTNVGMSFAPSTVIDSTIQFVTTGQIALRQGIPPGYITQEDSGLISLETPSGSLELETGIE